MISKSLRLVVILSVWSALVMGCAHTQQYAQLGKTGSSYAEAMEQLLVVSNNIWIDAHSEMLLFDQKKYLEKPNPNVKLEEEYSFYKKIDNKNIDLIARARKHAQLLKEYFEAVYRLASLDAPERAGKGVEGIIGSLSKLGLEVRNGIGTAAGTFARVALGFAIRGMLREALFKNEVISQELDTQEKFLGWLEKQLQGDLELIRNFKEERLLKKAFLSTTPVPNPEAWIENRRKILIMELTINELENAKGAAQKLNRAFRDLLEDKLTPEGITLLIADIESLISVIEALNPSKGSK